MNTQYAIARWYVTDFAIYEALDGSYYILDMDWDMFIPNIAEPIHLLNPLCHKQHKIQLRLLHSLQSQLNKRIGNCALQVVSAVEKSIFLSGTFPNAAIHHLTTEQFEQLTAEKAIDLLLENSPPSGCNVPKLAQKEYAEFLKFLVEFRKYSLENIFTLYSCSPTPTYVQTFAQWKKLGYFIPEAKRKNAIFLPITVQESFFERNGHRYPLSYAVQTERTHIAQGQLPVSHIEQPSALMVWDETVITQKTTPFIRDCDPQVLFHAIEKLAKTQGISIQQNSNISSSFYLAQTNSIQLPVGGSPQMRARWLCREYAAAVCHTTVSHSMEGDSMYLNLLSESLTWVLLYRYGLEESAEGLNCYYNLLPSPNLLTIANYLLNALCYICQRIDPSVYPEENITEQIRNNFLADLMTDTSTGQHSQPWTNRKEA